MQALVRLASIQMLKARMAVMMSKKFLQSRFRRWSVRRRYCARLRSSIVVCSCTARAAARAHYAIRISSALMQMNWLRRSICQKRLAQKLVAVVNVKSLVKMACARSRFRRVISASAVLTARLTSSLSHGIFCCSDLRVQLAKLGTSGAAGGRAGTECEKKSKMMGWRSRFFAFDFVDLSMSYSQSAATFQAGDIKGRIKFGPSTTCQTVAPATLLVQGVQEVLKNSGKEAYTLRFATEQQAQGWQKAFELIAKRSLLVKQKIEKAAR